MDIHKPKAAHSWREFLVEIGTIICGILIALGLEQGVEWLHWRHMVEDARETLVIAERALYHDAAEREGQSKCLAAEFRAIQGVLDRASGTGVLESLPSVRNPARRGWTFGVYEGVYSGQALPHFPVTERVVVTSINRWSAYLILNRDIEMRDWNVLRTLEAARRKPDAGELATLRSALSDAVYEAGLMRGAARQIAQRIADHGLLGADELREIWDKGVQDGLRAVSSPCSNRSESDTQQLLRQFDVPLIPPPATEFRPPNYPRGAG